MVRLRLSRRGRKLGNLIEHEAADGDDVQICERAEIAITVLDETMEAGRPPKKALCHPAPRQQDEATLGLG